MDIGMAFVVDAQLAQTMKPSERVKVYGTLRRSSSVNFWSIEELGVAAHPNLSLVEYDLTDLSSSIRLLQSTKVIEVYNLVAQSFVGV